MNSFKETTRKLNSEFKTFDKQINKLNVTYKVINKINLNITNTTKVQSSEVINEIPSIEFGSLVTNENRIYSPLLETTKTQTNKPNNKWVMRFADNLWTYRPNDYIRNLI